MRHSFMEAISEELASQSIATFRYQFPYLEQGGGRPDPPAVLVATVRAAVQAATEAAPWAACSCRRQIVGRTDDFDGSISESAARRSRHCLLRVPAPPTWTAFNRALTAPAVCHCADVVPSGDARQIGRAGAITSGLQRPWEPREASHRRSRRPFLRCPEAFRARFPRCIAGAWQDRRGLGRSPAGVKRQDPELTRRLFLPSKKVLSLTAITRSQRSILHILATFLGLS